jgi:hypothetical protein
MEILANALRSTRFLRKPGILAARNSTYSPHGVIDPPILGERIASFAFHNVASTAHARPSRQ